MRVSNTILRNGYSNEPELVSHLVRVSSFLTVMKKISTLYKKDPKDLGRVINELNPENQWVLSDQCLATRKFDGTACAIIGGSLYKRYDVKKGRNVPDGAIPCQDPDLITRHWPHWLLVDENKPEDKWFIDGHKNSINLFETPLMDGTYELCGPEINGNMENLPYNQLIAHGSEILDIDSFNFDFLRGYLKGKDIEGIVFHHPDGRMCKIRKKDFGFKR